MTTLDGQITKAFLAKLEASQTLDTEMLRGLATLFVDAKKVKAEELVKLYAHHDESDVR